MEAQSAGLSGIRNKVVDMLYSKKGHITDMADILTFLEGQSVTGKDAEILLRSMREDGTLSVMGDNVFLNDERYLPKVRCLICDGMVKREELIPFYRVKYYSFVNWGFHKMCLEGGALELMLCSGMFRVDNGDIYPNYEYGDESGKNPITVAIKYLRSEEFMYQLELNGTDRK